MRGSSLLAVAAAATAALLATACSGGSGSGAVAAANSAPSSAPATSPAAAASSPASSAGGSGGTAGALNTCSLLSVARASALTGQHFSSAKASTIAPGQDQCDYSLPAGQDMTVIVYQPSSGVTWQMMTSVQSGVGKVTSVSGVGDKAIMGSIELDVQTGGTFIAVENAGGLNGQSASIAVAKAIISALD